MPRTWGLSLAVAVGLAVSAQPAAAQTPELPRFSVGVGAGVSDPMHGDFDFIAPSWDADIRGATSEHVTVEAFVSEWRHKEESERLNIPIQNPSGAIIGRIGRLAKAETRTSWVIGANVLPTFTSGRVSVSAGVGAGFMMLRSRLTDSLTDCVGAAICRGRDDSNTFGSLTGQLVGGSTSRSRPTSWHSACTVSSPR
jgi:hypothetical protein